MIFRIIFVLILLCRVSFVFCDSNFELKNEKERVQFLTSDFFQFEKSCFLNQTMTEQDLALEEGSNSCLVREDSNFYQGVSWLYQTMIHRVSVWNEAFHKQFPSLPSSKTILKFVGATIVVVGAVTYIFRRYKGAHGRPAHMTKELLSSVDSLCGELSEHQKEERASFEEEVLREEALARSKRMSLESLMGFNPYDAEFKKEYPNLEIISTEEEEQQGITRISLIMDKAHLIRKDFSQEQEQEWLPLLDQNAHQEEDNPWGATQGNSWEG